MGIAEATVLQVNLTCIYQDFLGTKLPSKNFRGDTAQTLTSHEAQYKMATISKKVYVTLFYFEHCTMIIR